MFTFCYLAEILQVKTFRGQRDMGKQVIEVKQLKFSHYFTSGLRSKPCSSMAHFGKIRGMESGVGCLTFVSNGRTFCESCH